MTKLTPLPPGEYTVVVDRVRKVRNKPLKRVHMRIDGGPHHGQPVTQVISPDPFLGASCVCGGACNCEPEDD